MNETVKAALLSQRQRAKNSVSCSEQDLARIRGDLAVTEQVLISQRQRLADIELHLRDNGVDLAAVDAEAEKANPFKMDGLRTLDAFDPTAGLAKALDEA